MGSAVGKIQKVLDDDNQPTRRPVIPGEVEKTIALARSGLIRNQKKAVINMYRMAQDSDRVRNQIVEEGGVIPLIAMSKAKSSEVVELALKTLGELSRTKENRQKIVDNGGCTPMVEGVKHKKYSIRVAAIEAICHASENDDVRIKIISGGATPSLLRFLVDAEREDSLEIEIKALTAIRGLSRHPKNHNRMVRDQALAALYTVVQSPLKSVRHKSLAMQTIAELCKSDANHKKVTELDGNQGLRKIILLVDHYDDSIRQYAAKSIESLASNVVLVEKLVEEGVLIPLKKLIKHHGGKMDLALSGIKALTELAQNVENQKIIVKEGFVPHVLRLANSGTSEVEKAATLAMARLAQSNVNRPKIIYHGGFKPLIYNAQYGKDELKEQSKEVLSNLFKMPGAKRDQLVKKAVDKFRSG
eukprot:CAMPEP_0173431438 /NCGR_PEP_ID=MMETSP1357-20121228/9572_1 /TAXON_ID=77926 /ORGANISM="Hemiselmis rufescens, Strain PCC563" /LENGTH=415 /DNA_ID=CAMNT_0014395913 /DNA_START=170 /DNA_END=1413 /DNA_ORIENTATION=+